MADSYDLVVIGAGPGGYVAAIRAAQLGLRVALVEKDQKLGGTCLLRGCIPTKSLLHSADLLEDVKGAHKHGIVATDVRVDFGVVQKQRQKVVDKSAAGVSFLMKKNKIEVIAGVGRLTAPHQVSVKTDAGARTLETKHVILATGSAPKVLAFLKQDGQRVITSDEALTLERPPASMAILGAGAVGVEFASIYSRFGTKCTVVEALDRVLPVEDAEVSAELDRAFRKRGIDILTSCKVAAAEVSEKGVTLTMEGGKVLNVETVLVAVGRRPVTDGLGLAEMGVATAPGGFVLINEYMQTSVPHLYAIGDIVPTPQLAHVASAEALLAVEHLAGHVVAPIKYQQTPGCTYCDPEVASVGLSEAKAKEQGYTVKVGRFPFSALGKARIADKTEGFVKIVSDAQYDELLGVHIIGPHATELIAEACVALRLESTTLELAHTIHAHPTLSEAVLEAAHATLGQALHL